MTDPIRLFNESTSTDLALALRAERELTASLDGAALKGRVLANVASGAVPSALSVTASTWAARALPAVLAGVVGVGVGVAGTLIVVDKPPREQGVLGVAQAPVEAPRAPVVVAPVLSDAPADPSDATLDSETPSPSARPPARPPSPAASTLADETRRYERAQAALRDGRAGVAADELKDHLRAYPSGALRDEVRLTLLEALYGAGRHVEARRLAASLLKDRGFADRHDEIMRVLLRAHLAIGECAEARRVLNMMRAPSSGLAHAVDRCGEDVPLSAGDGSAARRE